MVSRNEGYRRGAGKEQISIAVLQEFLQVKLGKTGELITGYEDNYRFGDLRFPGGATIECKGQPIDPVRYKQNFVELFEVTRNDLHLGGLQRLAELLRMSVADLERCNVRFRGSTSRVGNLARVSVSVTSIASSAFTAYVNYINGGQHIYLYERTEILRYLSDGVKRGLVRGAGNSNEDTYAVFVPLARMRWSRLNGDWVAAGDQPESTSLSLLVSTLQ